MTSLEERKGDELHQFETAMNGLDGATKLTTIQELREFTAKMAFLVKGALPKVGALHEAVVLRKTKRRDIDGGRHRPGRNGAVFRSSSICTVAVGFSEAGKTTACWDVGSRRQASSS